MTSSSPTPPQKKRPAFAAGFIAFMATAIGTLVYVNRDGHDRMPTPAPVPAITDTVTTEAASPLTDEQPAPVEAPTVPFAPTDTVPAGKTTTEKAPEKPKATPTENETEPQPTSCLYRVTIRRIVEVGDKVMVLVTPDAEVFDSRFVASFDVPLRPVPAWLSGGEWRLATVKAIDGTHYTFSSYGSLWDAWSVRAPLLDHEGSSAAAIQHNGQWFPIESLDQFAPEWRFETMLPCDLEPQPAWFFGVKKNDKVGGR